MFISTTVKTVFVAGVLAAAALSSNSASATVVLSTGYDLPNGDGRASNGTFNYWDAAYTGSGSTTTDGAALAGGHGKLTDGVVATTPWDQVSNTFGTGLYVGWLQQATSNPVLTFHFASGTKIDTITINLDNSNIGGVLAPASILVDGIAQSFTAPTLGTVGAVTLGGLSLTGTSHTIQFEQVPSNWAFVSEIGFSTAVPEPATWALMIAGFGMTGFAARRRRSNIVAA